MGVRYYRPLRPQTLIAPWLVDAITARLPAYRASRADRQRERAERDEADRITAAEAAKMFHLTTDQIRQWVKRGHLRPVGKRGRANLFQYDAVAEAWRKTSARRHYESSGGSRIFDPADLEANVTTTIAARAIEVMGFIVV